MPWITVNGRQTVMGFSTTTIKVSTTDGLHFVVLEEFSYTANNGNVHIIPVGATTDGISSPRELWEEIPPFGEGWLAAVLHDHLYRDTLESKTTCDLLFYEALLSLGVSVDKATILYAAVDHLGWDSFEEDRTALSLKVQSQMRVTS